MFDFSSAPHDPIERLIWLGGVDDQVKDELDAQLRRAYFEARLSGRIETALNLGFHSRKQILRYTRNENEARGRVVRHWGDGLR